ncbi:TolC family protein [Foetidibacter luteolus]|uniref:TolC family protein n=1 Tax=Foetidibacter luteolus TaxID=2608880 RepID=UPI00129A48D2|nr:TolC family protein [Foetidibacter luteolus]
MNILLYRLALCAGILLFVFKSNAQSDTLRLTLKETEKLFLDSNLLLLAAHYNVDAGKALVQQARLWDNPELETDQNIYADGRFFQHGKDRVTGQPTGQYFIQVQQLVKTAGKRNKLVSMASTNVRISELQLQEVMRTLRLQLRQDYFTVLHQLKSRNIINTAAGQLALLLKAQEAQLKLGNTSEKELLRLQAEATRIQQDLLETGNILSDAQTGIKTLLRITGNLFILPVDDFSSSDVHETAGNIFYMARQNNSGFLLQQTQVLYEEQNLSYQKALRTPDIRLGTAYDHNSNYAPNYVGFGVSLPLPLFNRNQGNIKAAQFAVKQQQVMVTQAETELRNNISNALNKLMMYSQQTSVSQSQFHERLEKMFTNMVNSYRERKINLLELMDFFNTYKDTEIRRIQLQLNWQLAAEELNYHAGADIINK